MFILSWKLSYTQPREVHIYFIENMVDAGMSARVTLVENEKLMTKKMTKIRL